MMQEVVKEPVPGADKGGTWVVMGDKQYKIAPLNFKALRTLSASIGALAQLTPGAMPTAEQMGSLVQLAHAAMLRNYPAISEDAVAEALDFGNFPSVLGAVMGSAIPKEQPKGEAPASP